MVAHPFDPRLARLDAALSALRRGDMVLLRAENGSCGLVKAAEFADIDPQRIIGLARSQPILCLTSWHLKSVGKSVRADRPAYSLPAQNLSAEQIIGLALGDKGLWPSGGGLLAEHPDSLVDLATRLLADVKLLPAALLCRLSEDAVTASNQLAHHFQIPVLEARDLTLLRQQADSVLQISARVALPLAICEDAEMVMFRSQNGREEHFAVIIKDGLSQEAPLVRLHSQCMTGDVLGSLKCDCGPQLQHALLQMAEAGGGVLLYLAQEGRDIGLLNKMRTYALQAAGLDTVDANHRLGFETDRRVFQPAAQMLKELGVERLKLLTNNPDKIQQLTQFHLEVVERVSLSLPANAHNARYLQAKKQRTGHLIDND